MNRANGIPVVLTLMAILLGIVVLAGLPLLLLARNWNWAVWLLAPMLEFLSSGVVLILLIIVFVLSEAARKYWAARQHALLWLLTVAAERSMPLAPAVEAFARESGGLFGRRAKRLAQLLAAGSSLPDALERCSHLLPLSALPMVRIGSQSGALASALRQAATIENLNEPVWMALTGKLSYLLLMPMFGLGVLAFVMTRIIPSFAVIFKDFHATLPSITQWLISVSNLSLNYLWPLLALFFLFAGWLLLYAIVRYFGWIRWDLPGLGRLVRRLDAANILDSLALATQGQRSIGESIESLAQTYPKTDIQRHLHAAAADVAAGQDWCESLNRRGLIRRADLGILQAAQRAGNLTWALQEMAQSGRRRFAYRLQAIAQTAFPPLVILFGLIVMFIVVALFVPLVTLIQRLT